MAIFESVDRPEISYTLAARHLVGRSKACLLCIDDRQVSGEHASLEWKGASWEVRDLGSRNGTFVDDKRLDAGGRHALLPGMEVRFAKSSRWKLVDDSGPVAMAVPLSDPGGPAASMITAEDGMLTLPPGVEVPELCVYQDSAGRWLAEYPDREQLIQDQECVTIGGRVFRMLLPNTVASTVGIDEVPALSELGLYFAVSSDEEYVELRVRHREQQWELKPRSHQYPLLLLARARLRDREQGSLSVSAHGWVYQDELVNMLDYSPNRLHTEIYRARRQLASLGIAGAANLVERRGSTKQLRIGVTDLHVETI